MAVRRRSRANSRDWRRLHRVNRAATASLNLEEMLKTVVTVVAEAAGTDTCAVYLYNPEEDVLTLRATVGLNQDGGR